MVTETDPAGKHYPTLPPPLLLPLPPSAYDYTPRYCRVDEGVAPTAAPAIQGGGSTVAGSCRLASSDCLAFMSSSVLFRRYDRR
ncbi:hypothetical protein E2C01_013626 [Portunus trituberculatus]|uniref:Uncharacterized protein n=1 Tax=Portunus trituberculatus TaxID=210409 RepID=A0A5B7DGS3_PORTR|nr:hypothetical protein [Portunus trituberculatus]